MVNPSWSRTCLDMNPGMGRWSPITINSSYFGRDAGRELKHVETTNQICLLLFTDYICTSYVHRIPLGLNMSRGGSCQSCSPSDGLQSRSGRFTICAGHGTWMADPSGWFYEWPSFQNDHWISLVLVAAWVISSQGSQLADCHGWEYIYIFLEPPTGRIFL